MMTIKLSHNNGTLLFFRFRGASGVANVSVVQNMNMNI